MTSPGCAPPSMSGTRPSAPATRLHLLAADHPGAGWPGAEVRMLVVCPGCGARYQIAAERLSPQGARARCPKCERMFRVGLPSEAASDSRRANLRPVSLPGTAAPRAHAPPRPVLKPSPPNTEAVLPPPPI